MARFEKLEFAGQSSTTTDACVRTRQAEIDVDWLQQADDQRRRGMYENALRLYSRALEFDKAQVIGWAGQVQMLVLLEELQEAELWSRKGLELFSNNGELMAGRAQALCRIGDIRQSHVLSDGSLKQTGQSAYRWMVRGELLLAGNQNAERHCFDKARQMDDDWLVALEIALVYLHYDQPGRAHERARQAAEQAADQPYAWYVKARCEAALGHSTQALSSLERCLERAPGHADAEQLQMQLERGGFSVARAFRWLLGG